MSRRGVICLGLIAASAVLLGFFTLSRGHLWWDDFAGYLLQSKSILDWKMGEEVRRNAFTVENSSYPPGPEAYPWGFPLLMAPVYAVFGLNPLWLKMMGLVFYGVFVLCTALLARSSLDEIDTLLVTGMLAFAPSLIGANDLIQSDIPFLAFSTLGLFLIGRFPSGKTAEGVAAGAVIFMAFFLRTNGVLLLAPLLVSGLLAYWPDWRSMLRKLAAPGLTFAGLAALQMIIFPGGQSSYFTHFSMFSPARLLDNLMYYLWLPALTFEQIPGGWALYPPLAALALVSLGAHWRRDAGLHVYGWITCLLFIIWPERQGLRFIYPALPFLFIAAFDGLRLSIGRLRPGWQKMAGRAARAILGLVALAAFGVSAFSAVQVMKGGREINGPFDVYSKQMYEFVREETPVESVMVFVRPRALRLFTDRNAFMTENCSDLVKGDYVILHQKMGESGQIAPDDVGACVEVALEEVYRNKRFSVYMIRKR